MLEGLLLECLLLILSTIVTLVHLVGPGLVFSSPERAIQLSLEAVAVVARLVAFLGTPMVSDNSCGGGVEGGGDDG